ncbi:MAG TPA: sigma-70 family RNA polymerase sigma factor [Bryobacteraceae bacterium]|jgi:RNA polymerase sigma-70 factor (ECF subfamily)|nr:sigma-70 family RNA polymerase sigma factor [Bryobacteraceae bacterium]
MYADDSADSQIIERLHRRDPEGLAAAYDRYGRTAYALFVRIIHDTTAAEDLVQELFLRLWNRSREFDSNKGALGVWLLSIARNMAIDYVRSAQSRFASRLRSMDHVDALCFSHNPTGRESRIHDVRIVQEAFATLSADEKRVMELAYFEGFSQSEIAENIHEPLGTVKSRMRAALARLRSVITGSKGQ